MNNTIGQSFPNYVREQLRYRENTLKQLDRVNTLSKCIDFATV